ncbi:flagellar hook-basal body complex protein [Oceanobacillus kapialis]|uniref:Flagellar hook protein FlgE n=1 Tax=Oceanobacillus kapialis TaxID=481353 RepID=A0ABW5PYN7_9BACI
MLRSMYAGISGMKGFQTKLDVIGNNIANVNTSGFKKGRVTFQDMMSQTTAGAQGATEARGGVNPSQVGLGSQLGTIDNIHTQGFRQTTNSPLDFALEGDGMFVVQNGDQTAYTRAGNFYLDESGAIVNPQGYYLTGYQSGTNVTGTTYTGVDGADNEISVSVTNDGDNIVSYVNGNGERIEDDTLLPDGELQITDQNGNNLTVAMDANGGVSITMDDDNGEPMDVALEETNMTEDFVSNTVGTLSIPDSAQSFSVQANGTVSYIDEFGQPRIAGQIALASFSNAAGLEKSGSNLFLNSENAGYNGLVTPESEGAASIVSGSLEMSNVDLSEEFTEMITAQRGFQANTRIITTSDEILQELVNLKR